MQQEKPERCGSAFGLSVVLVFCLVTIAISRVNRPAGFNELEREDKSTARIAAIYAPVELIDVLETSADISRQERDRLVIEAGLGNAWFAALRSQRDADGHVSAVTYLFRIGEANSQEGLYEEAMMWLAGGAKDPSQSDRRAPRIILIPQEAAFLEPWEGFRSITQ